jgi:hypothetical protein
VKLLLSLDPGKVTGWSLWTWDHVNALERVKYGVIPEGIYGFIAWWHRTNPRVDAIVFERFFLGDDFVNDRTMQASLIEGALLALVPPAFPTYFQRRVDKRAVPDHVLKQHGLWLTGTQVGWEDGRDVNDSQIHALAWAKRQEHEPTLRRYFG